MSWAEIRKLTWAQYVGICCHPRDERGQLVPRIVEEDGAEKPKTPKERAFCHWRQQWGWTAAQCEAKWAENTELQTYRAEIDKLGLEPAEFDRRVVLKMLEIIARRRA